MMKNSNIKNFFQITAAICLIALCLGLPFAAVYATDQRRISHTETVSGSPQPPGPTETEPPQPEPLSTEEKLLLLTNFRTDPEVGVTTYPSYTDNLTAKELESIYEHIARELTKLIDIGLLPKLDLSRESIQYYSTDLEYVRYTKGERQLNTWAMSLYADYSMLLVMDADTYTVYELLFHYNDPEHVQPEQCLFPVDDNRFRVFLEKYWSTPVGYFSIDQIIENEQNFNFDYKLKLQPANGSPGKGEFDYTLFITAYSMVLAMESCPIYGQVTAR